MTQGRNNPPDASITDYRYPDKRKNNPPAGLAAQGQPPRLAETRYAYDPHLPPVLRFDPAGGPDHLQALLEKARTQTLSADEVKQLSDALQNQQLWLKWAGKH